LELGVAAILGGLLGALDGFLGFDGELVGLEWHGKLSPLRGVSATHGTAPWADVGIKFFLDEINLRWGRGELQ